MIGLGKRVARQQTWRPSVGVTMLAVLLVGPVRARAQDMASQYQRAAQLYRNAAAQCPPRAACYNANAEYHECLARSLGPGGGSCSQPTCSTSSPPCQGGGGPSQSSGFQSGSQGPRSGGARGGGFIDLGSSISLPGKVEVEESDPSQGEDPARVETWNVNDRLRAARDFDGAASQLRQELQELCGTAARNDCVVPGDPSPLPDEATSLPAGSPDADAAAFVSEPRDSSSPAELVADLTPIPFGSVDAPTNVLNEAVATPSGPTSGDGGEPGGRAAIDIARDWLKQGVDTQVEKMGLQPLVDTIQTAQRDGEALKQAVNDVETVADPNSSLTNYGSSLFDLGSKLAPTDDQRHALAAGRDLFGDSSQMLDNAFAGNSDTPARLQRIADNDPGEWMNLMPGFIRKPYEKAEEWMQKAEDAKAKVEDAATVGRAVLDIGGSYLQSRAAHVERRLEGAAAAVRSFFGLSSADAGGAAQSGGTE